MMMRTVIVAGGFHNSSVTLRVPDIPHQLSASQQRRVDKAMCGLSDCTCGGWHRDSRAYELRPEHDNLPLDMDIEYADELPIERIVLMWPRCPLCGRAMRSDDDRRAREHVACRERICAGVRHPA